MNVYDEALFYHTEAGRLQGLIALHTVRRGVQSLTCKNTVPPKKKIPTWNQITLVPAKLSVLPKITFTLHSHLEYMKFYI